MLVGNKCQEGVMWRPQGIFLSHHLTLKQFFIDFICFSEVDINRPQVSYFSKEVQGISKAVGLFCFWSLITTSPHLSCQLLSLLLSLVCFNISNGIVCCKWLPCSLVTWSSFCYLLEEYMCFLLTAHFSSCFIFSYL